VSASLNMVKVTAERGAGINSRKRLDAAGIEAVFVNVTHDPDDGQQTQIAIHISKLDGVADGVLLRHRSRASDSLITATCGESAPSRSSKIRPRITEFREPGSTIAGDAEIRIARRSFCCISGPKPSGVLGFHSAS